MSSSIDKCKGCKQLRKYVWKKAGGKQKARIKFKNVKFEYDRHYDRVYYNKMLIC
ncbi:MAG: hypothetical protein ACRCXT_11360 [Paraclostridium sp.]